MKRFLARVAPIAGFALLAITGCRVFLGPEAAIRVEIVADSVSLIGEVPDLDDWSYTIGIEVNDDEQVLAVGQTLSLECTTWDWLRLAMTVTDDSRLIDRTASYGSSILGRDILNQSPYTITRDIDASSAGNGSIVWRFQFSLDAAQM